MMTIDEMIAVLQEAGAKKSIQSRLLRCCCSEAEREWADDPNPSWDFFRSEFRVRPKPIEGWVNVYPQAHPMFYRSLEEANDAASPNRIRCVHVREVED